MAAQHTCHCGRPQACTAAAPEAPGCSPAPAPSGHGMPPPPSRPRRHDRRSFLSLPPLSTYSPLVSWGVAQGSCPLLPGTGAGSWAVPWVDHWMGEVGSPTAAARLGVTLPVQQRTGPGASSPPLPKPAWGTEESGWRLRLRLRPRTVGSRRRGAAPGGPIATKMSSLALCKSCLVFKHWQVIQLERKF